MKTKWFRMGCVLLAALMLWGLTACGNENPPVIDPEGTTTSSAAGDEPVEEIGFYDADGKYYAYFDEDSDYIWDGFTDEAGNRFYFFDEDADGTVDGYSDAEGNRFYYNGGGDGEDEPVIPVTTEGGEAATNASNGTTAAGGTAATNPNGQTVATKATSGTNKGTTTTTKTPAAPTVSSKELYKAVKGTTVKILMANEPSALNKKEWKAFELAYGCKVEPQVIAWNDFKNQFLPMVTSGNVPDTVGIPDETFLKWVSKGLLQPLDAYININDGDWSKEIWDAFSWKGSHYGANSDGGVTPLFCIYNASLFKAKGEKTPLEYYNEGKWNFNNFKKCCIAMTYGDVTGASVGWRYLLHLCNGNTAVKVDNAKGTVTNNLNAKESVTATDVLVELKRGEYVTFEAPFEKFGNSQIAMVLERPWNIIGQFDLRNTTLKNAEIEIAPLPKGPDAKTEYCVSIMNGKGVPTKAKNPLGACAYYYFSMQYGKAHGNDADVVENRRLTYTDAQYQFCKDYAAKHPSINTFVYGVGNWYSDDWGYWASMILDGLSVQAANDKFAGEFQSMIDTLGNT